MSLLTLWHIQTLSRTSAPLYVKNAECFPSACKIKTDWKRSLLKVAEMDERDITAEMWAIQPPAQGYAVSRGAELHEKYLPALAPRPNNPQVKVVGSCSPQSEVKGTQSREDHLSPLLLHSIFPPFFSLLSSPDLLFVLPLPYHFDLFAEKNEKQKAGANRKDTHEPRTLKNMSGKRETHPQESWGNAGQESFLLLLLLSISFLLSQAQMLRCVKQEAEWVTWAQQVSGLSSQTKSWSHPP